MTQLVGMAVVRVEGASSVGKVLLSRPRYAKHLSGERERRIPKILWMNWSNAAHFSGSMSHRLLPTVRTDLKIIEMQQSSKYPRTIPV